MNVKRTVSTPAVGCTAYILDDAWPEYASYVDSARRADDQLIAPGLFGAARLARYGWPGSVIHGATVATLHRHFAMRQVAHKGGGERQAAYLHHDLRVAHALARRIDYRAEHLVVAQTWLPWLHEAGVFGGRSYDVLMSRYPLADIHRRLDDVARECGATATISDFRADKRLVHRETLALEEARRIITPHHDIASLFGSRAVTLSWHKPPLRPAKPGHRTVFLGPTITRQRADIARDIARGLSKPLIVMGPNLESPDFWTGVSVEPRQRGVNWLDDIGAIIHPMPMTSQPRDLLQALANGVKIYATRGCGLPATDYSPIESFMGAL